MELSVRVSIGMLKIRYLEVERNELNKMALF